MSQKEIIGKIKELRWILSHKYSDEILIELYHLIDLLE